MMTQSEEERLVHETTQSENEKPVHDQQHMAKGAVFCALQQCFDWMD